MVGVVQQPPGVVRHSVLHAEDHRREIAGEDAHALLADQRAHRMELQEARDDQLGGLQGGLGLGDPRITVVGLGLRWGTRVVDLPRQRRPQVGVLGQQVVEDGGAGAGLADDDDGLCDRAVGHRGVRGAVRDDVQPVHQRPLEVAAGDLDTQRR